MAINIRDYQISWTSCGFVYLQLELWRFRLLSRFGPSGWGWRIVGSGSELLRSDWWCWWRSSSQRECAAESRRASFWTLPRKDAAESYSSAFAGGPRDFEGGLVVAAKCIAAGF